SLIVLRGDNHTSIRLSAAATNKVMPQDHARLRRIAIPFARSQEVSHAGDAKTCYLWVGFPVVAVSHIDMLLCGARDFIFGMRARFNRSLSFFRLPRRKNVAHDPRLPRHAVLGVRSYWRSTAGVLFRNSTIFGSLWVLSGVLYDVIMLVMTQLHNCAHHIHPSTFLHITSTTREG
ncbi:unnamed protein product, partial [Ectocarpus fasciculatus]